MLKLEMQKQLKFKQIEKLNLIFYMIKIEVLQKKIKLEQLRRETHKINNGAPARSRTADLLITNRESKFKR